MRVLVQKTKDASVLVDGKVVGSSSFGLTLFVGFTRTDKREDISWMANKIVHMRVFEDESGVMNLSLLDKGGSILAISQFTLYGDCRKGNRPSYSEAAPFHDASVLYDLFVEELRKYVFVETGIFGSDMQVTLSNIGPTTIWLER